MLSGGGGYNSDARPVIIPRQDGAVAVDTPMVDVISRRQDFTVAVDTQSANAVPWERGFAVAVDTNIDRATYACAEHSWKI